MIRSGKCCYCSLRLVLATVLLMAVSVKSVWRSFGTESQATQYGMKAEGYDALTEDGYQLVVYRILPEGPPRGVVLLQHGIRQSSADWLQMKQNLPQQLVSAGMEVWLGNSRASTESEGHTRLSRRSETFWNFSFHEIGYYDLAAMIDTVLAESRRSKLQLVAYSEGSTAVLTLLSERPSYNSKVASVNLIAPASILGNSNVRNLAALHNRFGAFLPFSLQEIITGSDEPYENSPKQLEHFQQLLISGNFHQYDYGHFGNKVVYGAAKPPSYSLGRVKAPVMLHFGGNDQVVHPKDVRKLAVQLYNSKLVRLIEHAGYDHKDFMSRPDAAREVYPRITHLVLGRF